MIATYKYLLLAYFGHYASADYIFSGLLGPLSSFYVSLKIDFAEADARGRGQYCTITLLYMNRFNKTKSAIFVSLLCILLPKALHSELIW